MVLRLSPLSLPAVPTSGPLDWARWTDLPGIAALDQCPQDPEWHAEGDVGVHTRMVLTWLLDDPTWAALPQDEREDVFLACLWHDIAKPATTAPDGEGRVRSPGHSRRGAVDARVLAWRAGLPWWRRERIAELVRHHQVPFFAVDSEGADRKLALLSHRVRLDLLALLNRADGFGRVCDDLDRMALNNQLFEALADELGCRTSPYPFPSDHHRVLTSRSSRPITADVYDDTWGEVVVLSGLPASGKDHWLRSFDGPVVSLDAIRRELQVSPTGDQGRVVAAARERAREHLRKKQRFAWNATNISRSIRDRPVELALKYGARVRTVVVEAPLADLRVRNRDREEVVPEKAIERMLRRWEPPTPVEAHAVEVISASGPAPSGRGRG